MNKLHLYKPVTLRFRRWSRKSYALFCSVGRCVTIGFLRNGVADASLRKQANYAYSEAVSVCPGEEESTDKERAKAESELLFMEEVCPYVEIRGMAVPHQPASDDIRINKVVVKGPVWKLRGFFYV